MMAGVRECRGLLTRAHGLKIVPRGNQGGTDFSLCRKCRNSSRGLLTRAWANHEWPTMHSLLPALDKLSQHHPLRIAPRMKMFPARVKRVATGLFRQRMTQQGTLLGVLQVHHGLHRLEILAGLLFVPKSRPRRKPLQPKRRASRVAHIAPRMSLPLFQENRLHFRLEKLIIELRFLRHSANRKNGDDKKQFHREIFTTILPKCAPLATCAKACAASSNGKTRSITGLIPASERAPFMCSNISRLPTMMPCSRRFCIRTGIRLVSVVAPVSTPITLMVPPMRIARNDLPKVPP